VVPGHACLARLLADTGGVWGAAATNLRFYLAIIGVFLRAEPTPLDPGRVLAPLNAVKPGGGLWIGFKPCLAGSHFCRCGGCFFWPHKGRVLDHGAVCNRVLCSLLCVVRVRYYALCGYGRYYILYARARYYTLRCTRPVLCIILVLYYVCICLSCYVLITGPCVGFRRIIGYCLYEFFKGMAVVRFGLDNFQGQALIQIVSM
jgi:hypothetical protein